jgi:hypothetical protein
MSASEAPEDDHCIKLNVLASMVIETKVGMLMGPFDSYNIPDTPPRAPLSATSKCPTCKVLDLGRFFASHFRRKIRDDPNSAGMHVNKFAEEIERLVVIRKQVLVNRRAGTEPPCSCAPKSSSILHQILGIDNPESAAVSGYGGL